MKSSNIGGQAVLEGIMMKNRETYSVAVRKPDGEIEVDIQEYKGVLPWKAPQKIPFIRGIFNFVDSLVLGMKTLTYSASFFEDEEEEILTEDEARKQEKKEKLIMNLTVVVSVLIAVGIFMVLPYYLSSIIEKHTSSHLVMTVLEGVIRVAIFLIYIVLISRTKDIKRTFMYHGAEHKCINCIEHGLELNVENVRKSSKQHKRCGTSFLFFVMIVSIIVCFFITAKSQIVRVLLRIALLPLIAGISYELIRVAGNSSVLLEDMAGGEPEAMRTESDKRTGYKTDCSDSISLKNAYKEGKEILAKAGITEADLDAWYLLEFVTGITKARYYMDPDQSMDPEAWKKYKEYLEKRRNHIPLQHITGSQEFMGLEFLVNEHVLIPRQDTEVLVEEALEIMKQEIFRSKGCLQLLDMCTGSGCILLSVMHYAEQEGIFIEGTGVDFSEQALMVAQKNEKHLRSTKKDEKGKVNWILSDLFENVSETYDMILSNPPYIRTAEIEKLQDEVKLHDPFSALDGKEDGLYFYRKIVTDAKQFLKTGGILAFEIGYDQGKEVSDLMKKAGYDKVFVKKDLAGLDRIVCGVYY